MHAAPLAKTYLTMSQSSGLFGPGIKRDILHRTASLISPIAEPDKIDITRWVIKQGRFEHLHSLPPPLAPKLNAGPLRHTSIPPSLTTPVISSLVRCRYRGVVRVAAHPNDFGYGLQGLRYYFKNSAILGHFLKWLNYMSITFTKIDENY